MIENGLNIVAFTATTGLTCFVPGAAALFVASGATTHGKRFIVPAIAGVVIANTLFFVLYGLGISAVLARSSVAFNAIRYLGGAYLIYLASSLLRRPPQRAVESTSGSHSASSHSFSLTLCKGLLIQVTNPKALLYFLAVLPQFTESAEPLTAQLVMFCIITALLDLVAYGFYGIVGSSAQRLSRGNWLINVRRATGLLFVLAGVRLLFHG